MGRGPRAVAAAGGRKVEKLTICKEGAWFTGNQAAHPGVPGRGAEGVRELLWAPRGAAGRLPDSSAPLWAPFFQLSWDRRARGSDFRERWTFENLIGALSDSLVFIFLSFRWPVMEIFVLRTLFRRGVQNPW